MSEFIPFVLFGGVWWFLVLTIVFIISLFISERAENGFYAFFFAIIFCVLNYYWGNFPVLKYLTIKNVSLYLIVGFLYSILRTYFKGIELKGDPDKKHFRLKEHVFRWWFLFPVSFLNWLLSDLLGNVYDFVYAKLEGMYQAVFNAGETKAVAKENK